MALSQRSSSLLADLAPSGEASRAPVADQDSPPCRRQRLALKRRLSDAATSFIIDARRSDRSHGVDNAAGRRLQAEKTAWRKGVPSSPTGDQHQDDRPARSFERSPARATSAEGYGRLILPLPGFGSCRRRSPRRPAVGRGLTDPVAAEPAVDGTVRVHPGGGRRARSSPIDPCAMFAPFEETRRSRRPGPRTPARPLICPANVPC